jgi:hypothetical protein
MWFRESAVYVPAKINSVQSLKIFMTRAMYKLNESIISKIFKYLWNVF